MPVAYLRRFLVPVFSTEAPTEGGTPPPSPDPPVVAYSRSHYTVVKDAPFATPAPTNTGGDVGPGGWSADTLPSGLAIDADTGVISGTPDTLGASATDVTAENGDGDGTDHLDWRVVVAKASSPFFGRFARR